MSPRSPPGLHKRTIFEQQCTHLTMTRLYGAGILCGSCRNPGPFRWLYQCTQDRDDLIEQAVSRGDFTNMDEPGCCLTSNLGIRLGSPAAREDTLSFFTEITQKQLASYSPGQIADILRQRQNVHLAIQRDKIRKNGAAILNRLTNSSGLDSPTCHYDFQNPWVCNPHEECQYRICQRCRPGSSDRAFLSLNAVAKGEIFPSAAAGFGFHIIGHRPIVDAEIMKTIGCRPVPLPQSTSTSEDGSPTSSVSVMGLLDAQIAQGRMLWDEKKAEAEVEDSDEDCTWLVTPKTPNSTPGQLKHSPGCENLGLYADAAPITCAESITPLLLTPPPSPIPDSESSAEDHRTELKAPCENGDHPTTSLPSNTQQSYQSHRNDPLHEPSFGETPNEAEPGTTQTSTTLPSHEDNFTPSPLKVGHGVAMLEESVELGVPDVITQV